MLPAFLITFREVIEASLIVATILGILVKLKQTKSSRTVWTATAAASILCIFILAISSILGLQVQQLYTGKVEQVTEGFLLITSGFFITWAVFFLHKYFSHYKVKLLQKLKSTVENEEQKGLFALVFIAVFREGFEIILFLTTIFLSAKPLQIVSGFGGGVVAGVLISLAFFTATIKLPIHRAFKLTSFLLILFAAGTLAKGVNEFVESGFIPKTANFTLPFFPSNTFASDIIHAIFGISKHMDVAQLVLYITYVICMTWYVFLKRKGFVTTN